MPVYHSHDFRSLTPFLFSRSWSPLFRETPSMKASSTSIRPWILSSAARASRIPLITPDWTHCWNRRWQVWYDGYRSASSTQGAPVRKTHKIRFRTARRSFQGRSRPSPRLGLWELGPHREVSFRRRRCSLSLMISLKSTTGRISMGPSPCLKPGCCETS